MPTTSFIGEALAVCAPFICNHTLVDIRYEVLPRVQTTMGETMDGFVSRAIVSP